MEGAIRRSTKSATSLAARLAALSHSTFVRHMRFASSLDPTRCTL
ncbi:MAG: hypothetical protein AVDCRST_MAG91-822 [uncultured Sphingomonadaceae bacterium]|uniref:Uncharacterized protein n=1 Tax=uncultured Sphingomonadaceae bacterium TaxID=169976 RepID=A0A6J4SF10_9SPHN|nr:MAG: hypothetical protein AVDCRST_MAG91-822 [uncultured Sphingomonadaceae bacterium]